MGVKWTVWILKLEKNCYCVSDLLTALITSSTFGNNGITKSSTVSKVVSGWLSLFVIIN